MVKLKPEVVKSVARLNMSPSLAFLEKCFHSFSSRFLCYPITFRQRFGTFFRFVFGIVGL